jgi:hypothetical protein
MSVINSLLVSLEPGKDPESVKQELQDRNDVVSVDVLEWDERDD